MESNTTKAATVITQIFFPQDLHMRLKLKATAEKTTMSAVVINSLERMFKDKEAVRG